MDRQFFRWIAKRAIWTLVFVGGAAYSYSLGEMYLLAIYGIMASVFVVSTAFQLAQGTISRIIRVPKEAVEQKITTTFNWGNKFRLIVGGKEVEDKGSFMIQPGMWLEVKLPVGRDPIVYID